MDYELLSKPEAYGFLRRIYDKCRKELGVKEGSVIGDVISKTGAKRAEILRKSALSPRLEEVDIANYLEDEGLVLDLGEGGPYAITFNGIWSVESIDLISDEASLVRWIQEKYFDSLFSKETGINDRNLSVALSLIALRAYSPGACMNLKNDSEVRQIWWEILKRSSSFLFQNRLTKSEFTDADFIDKKTNKVKGSEDPVVNIVRHSYGLKTPTNGRYVTNKLEYWIDVNDNEGDPSVEALSSVIRSLFGKLDPGMADKLSDFSNELCMDYGWRLESYLTDSSYLDVQFDSFVRNAFVMSAEAP